MPLPAPRISPTPSNVISINELRTHCSNCGVRELCLPVGLGEDEVEQITEILSNRLKLKKGEVLFHNGAAFTSLFAIRLGSFKTTVLSQDGREQVAGYHLQGDVIGLDGLSTDRHCCEAIALEDSEACVIPFDKLEDLSRKIPGIQHNLHRIVGGEITADHKVMLLLGSMRAEERLAAFLLSLSERYKRRGYSSTEFVLRMTREEIGSYLGLKLETVSRLFSRFQEEGLLQVQGRAVKIVDLPSLKRVFGQRS